VNGELAEEAQQLGEVVRGRIERAGGIEVLRSAVSDPGVRLTAAAVLEPLGLWDLAPQDDALELEASAAACRAAGWFAFPYPIAERLGRERLAEATLLLGAGQVVGMHADLDLEWSALDQCGRVLRVEAGNRTLLRTELAPFGVELAAVTVDGTVRPRAAAVLTALQVWWLLGLLEHAHADTLQYAQEREQFGRSLARFQAVGFRLADMTLSVRSLEELAKYTLWSISGDADGDAGLVDAVALRLAALDAADVVLRGAHQLHGAMGFTDEVDTSWLSRASQGVRRLPAARDETNAVLTALIGTAGFPELGRPAAVPRDAK
jgi:hypothetical protein